MKLSRASLAVAACLAASGVVASPALAGKSHTTKVSLGARWGIVAHASKKGFTPPTPGYTTGFACGVYIGFALTAAPGVTIPVDVANQHATSTSDLVTLSKFPDNPFVFLSDTTTCAGSFDPATLPAGITFTPPTAPLHTDCLTQGGITVTYGGTITIDAAGNFSAVCTGGMAYRASSAK